jgi:hypothetical protein
MSEIRPFCYVVIATCLAIAATVLPMAGAASGAGPPSLLFREDFEDADLARRGWYDGNRDMPHGLTQGPLKGGYNGKFYDSDEVLFEDDKWYTVEAYFKLDTLNLEENHPNRDGIVRGWVDGRLVVDRSDVILRSTDFPEMKFNQFLMAPYFGPGLLPHAQKLWIDDLAAGRKRPAT